MLYSLSVFAESISNLGKDDIAYNCLDLSFKPPLLNYIKDYVLSYIYTLVNPFKS